MVLSPDEGLNLRASIKADLISLQAHLQVGGNARRAARLARDLASQLERLADLEQTNDGVRHRVVEPPPAPRNRQEFLGERLARKFSTGAKRVRRKHYEITELPRPELP